MVDSLVTLNIAIVGVRFFAISRAIMRYLERISGHDAALRQLATTRADLVRRLVPLAPDGLSRTDRGSVLAPLVDDVDELQNLPLRVVQPVATGVIVAAASTAVVALVSPAAGLAMLTCMLIAAAAAAGWGWLAGARAERAIAPARAALASALTDYIGSFDTLMAYGAEPAARERVQLADRTLRRHVTRSTSAQGRSSGVLSAMSGLASVAIIALVAPDVPAHTTGALLALAALVPMAVFESFSAVPMAAAAWRKVRAAADHIADALPDEVPAQIAPDLPDDDDAAPLGANIRLRNVTAGWPGATPVLRGIDLDVPAGQRLLITGSSGAGKSTLAHVLVRFLEADGEYTLGGTDVHSVPGSLVRRSVGMTEQTPFLFDEDIRQNLLFARETATDDELVAVLERVGLGAWLRERGGLDGRVGERGALVSGGQAQRLALARALLHDVQVLVLDEPTAGVDPEMSDALLTDLLTAVPDRTVIVISHVSVPAHLIDRELRLADGRLLEV